MIATAMLSMLALQAALPAHDWPEEVALACRYAPVVELVREGQDWPLTRAAEGYEMGLAINLRTGAWADIGDPFLRPQFRPPASSVEVRRDSIAISAPDQWVNTRQPEPNASQDSFLASDTDFFIDGRQSYVYHATAAADSGVLVRTFTSGDLVAVQTADCRRVSVRPSFTESSRMIPHIADWAREPLP